MEMYVHVCIRGCVKEMCDGVGHLLRVCGSLIVEMVVLLNSGSPVLLLPSVAPQQQHVFQTRVSMMCVGSKICFVLLEP